jgi:hypothetical protein
LFGSRPSQGAYKTGTEKQRQVDFDGEVGDEQVVNVQRLSFLGVRVRGLVLSVTMWSAGSGAETDSFERNSLSDTPRAAHVCCLGDGLLELLGPNKLELFRIQIAEVHALAFV